jgi:hypothetical protein
MRVDIDHPSSFKDGVRVLLLMLRAKDNGSAKTDRKATKKIITQSPQEFDEALADLRGRLMGEERIYSTVNARSIDKAIRLFKYRQLDADYFATPDKHSFYLDLENRWISCLKNNKSAVESLFLFDWDFDSKLRLADLHDHLTKATKIVDRYDTRNGHHFITQPFNPVWVTNVAQQCLMKDCLMLWSYGVDVPNSGGPGKPITGAEGRRETAPTSTPFEQREGDSHGA